uniref:Variant surface glycoprotein n=1 Tax=Trypanosoma brucei TaxID=5691 RepID=S5G6Y4_9TRYP|nr:variant surface glycoprotein [Trypanosoma brucei]
METKVLGPFFILATVSFQVSADDEPIIANGWKGMCKVAATFSTGPGIARHLIESVTNAQKVTAEASRKVKVMAIKETNPKRRIAIQGLAQELDDSEKQIIGKLSTITTLAIEAAATSADMHGRINEFIGLLHKAQTTTSKTGYCLGAGTGDSHPAGDVAATACGSETISAEPQATRLTPDQIDDNGIKNGQAGTITGKSSTPAKCILFKDGSNSAATFFQDTSKVTLLGGLLEVTPATGGKAINVADSNKLRSNNEISKQDALSKAYDKLRQINAYKINDLPKDVASAIRQAASKDNLKTTIAKIYKQDNRDSTEGMPKDDQEAAVNALLGSDGTSIDNFIDSISSTQVLNIANSKTEDKALGTITDLDELSQILAYYNRKIITELTKAQSTLQSKSKHCNDKALTLTSDCSKYKANKTICETEDNCKWEGESDTKGECKPKDGKGQTSAAGAGDAGASDTAAKKCSDKKKEEECKSPNCKWDGKECKDSSILANKHFALSVVSAAFVALLF